MTIPKLKLISFPICPYVQRAMIILNEKNVPFDIEYIDLSSPPSWFHEISPLEKVPVLLVDDEPLFESMVICEYIDEITPASMYPSDPFARAQNRAWIEFGNNILSTTFDFMRTNDLKTFNHSKNILTDRFEVLEEEFSNGEYFNGDDFSMVDAVYAPIFRYHKRILEFKDYGIFEDAPNVKAWGDRLLQRSSVIKSVPENYEQRFLIFLENQNSIFGNEMLGK
mgnify:CR=1 FL=1